MRGERDKEEGGERQRGEREKEQERFIKSYISEKKKKKTLPIVCISNFYLKVFLSYSLSVSYCLFPQSLECLNSSLLLNGVQGFPSSPCSCPSAQSWCCFLLLPRAQVQGTGGSSRYYHFGCWCYLVDAPRNSLY